MIHFQNQRGSVMVVTLAVLLMLGLIGSAMVNTSNQDMNISDNFKRTSQAFYAAESGTELARNTLWTQYINTSMVLPAKNAGDPGSYSTYSAWLDGIGLVDSSSMIVASGHTVSRQGRVDSVRVMRVDIPGGSGTDLLVQSYGSDRSASSEKISEVLRISAGQFSGFDFAILAKNINCIMCHARVDDVKRYYNTDPLLTDTFDRVKIAALESLLLRTTSADSYVAGTLYTRGIVTDKKGNPITNLSPTNKGLEAWDMDANGKIIEPLNSVKMTNATGSPLPTFGNLYLDYPTDKALMTDGVLPTSFPAAIPDDNSNRIVDPAEFNIVAGASTGKISGGIMYGVPTGGSYGGGALPGTSNLTEVNNSYSGNLILVGTDANPIVINSQIAVDGDVVIQGKVVGDGEIYAKGNVYVTGDVTYADGTDMSGNRTFGYGSTGGANALSLAAGGNILVGDYLTTKSGDIMNAADRDLGDGTSGFSFGMSEISLFNRAEWSKTQAQLPDANGTLVNNPDHDPSYIPRYYTSGPGDPVYIYNKNYKKKGKNKGTYYDPTTRTWKGKEHAGSYDPLLLTTIPQGDASLAGAVIMNLAPAANWISETQLKQFWIADENARVNGTPFQFDGQLYTNNSIFSLARGRSKTGGQMHINGSIVAADIGMLVGVELRVNYDSRMRDKLNIADDSGVDLYRVSWLAQSGVY